jgi:hypothetical protein
MDNKKRNIKNPRSVTTALATAYAAILGGSDPEGTFNSSQELTSPLANAARVSSTPI